MDIKQQDTTKNTILKVSNDTDIFSTISNYRGELLGIVLILISIAHFQPDISVTKNLHLPIISQSIINILNLFGACGVKMFYFLAGYGAYFSLCRNPDDMQFYIRRAKRMFPYYYPLVIISLLIYHQNPIIIAGNLSLLGWWISNSLTRGGQFFWFHQAIYIIYILTPTFFRILNNSKKVFWNMSFIWLVFLGIGLAFPPEVKVQGTQAIPIFVTGMLLCKLKIEGFKINKKLEPVIYTLGICSLFFLVNFFPTYGGVFNQYRPKTIEHLLIDLFAGALMLLSIRMCLLISKSTKVGQILMKVLSVLGHRALEIYLIQAFILFTILVNNQAQNFKCLCGFLNVHNPGNLVVIQIIISIIVISTLIGIGYGKLMDVFIEKAINFYNKLRVEVLTLHKKIHKPTIGFIKYFLWMNLFEKNIFNYNIYRIN